MTPSPEPLAETTAPDEEVSEGDALGSPRTTGPLDPKAPAATTPLRRARRFAPMLLLAGVFAIASMVLPHVPRDRHIELRVADASTVTGVELSWTPHGDGEPILGSAWHFAAGDAPVAIDTTVSLPDGRYELDVAIERAGTRVSHHRSLTVADADRIAIPIP